MKVGSLVEMFKKIKNYTGTKGYILPVYKEIYTVRDIEPSMTPDIHPEPFLRFEEIYNTPYDVSFCSKGFREVQPPMDNEIEELMSECIIQTMEV